MCITVGMRAYLGKSMGHPAMRSLWRHNLACAIIAHRLASGGFLNKDTAYTSGILHDIGRVALGVIQPKDYAKLLEGHRGPPASILENEREMFGWDHCEAGKELIASWKLPKEFDAVVAEHHCARGEGGGWGMLELTKVSCRMADAAGYPSFVGCEAAPYDELLDWLPARERGNFFADLEALTSEVSKNIQAIESV